MWRHCSAPLAETDSISTLPSFRSVTASKVPDGLNETENGAEPEPSDRQEANDRQEASNRQEASYRRGGRQSDRPAGGDIDLRA